MTKKCPTLQELCFALGVTCDPAAAEAEDYDVQLTIKSFWRGWTEAFTLRQWTLL